MMSKPPFGLSASGQTSGSDSDLEDLSDEIDVDSSQDVTVEASEESTLEVSAEDSADESTLEMSDEFGVENTETPPPLSALLPAGMPGGIGSSLMASTPPPRRLQTILGLPLPSLPLPGVTASRPAPGPDLADDDDDEVTVMARPSVTDDEEEQTKVEPAATALHAAASRDGDDDEVTTALSAQASVEREKALRKSVPPSLDLPLPSPSYRIDSAGGQDGDEFEDPEDDDVELAHDTPAVISVDNEAIAASSYSADEEEPSSELEAVLAPRRPTGSPPLGSAIGSFGRGGDGFGAARLPTPSPGYGFSLPSPGQLPAPSNSPFSARTAPIGSPYAATRTTSAPMPAIQIPAPSGAAALPSSRSGMFFAVQVPVVGLLALIVAAGGGGVLLGARLWRSGAPAAMTSTTLATAPSPATPTAPVVQPVAPAAAPSAAAAAPAAAAPAAPLAAAPAAAPPAPTPGLAVPAPAPTAAAPMAEEAAPAPRPVKHAVSRPLARRTPMPGAAPGASPTPAKARPAKVAKVAKGWVDPFAE
jgi:hypothetical protein